MQGKITGKAGKEKYTIDGREVTKRQFDKAFPDQNSTPGGIVGGQGLGCWPMVSEGAAVHPDQIQEARESAARKGVPTEFDGQGRPVFTGRGHRKQYLAAYGYHDRNGGYGD